MQCEESEGRAHTMRLVRNTRSTDRLSWADSKKQTLNALQGISQQRRILGLLFFLSVVTYLDRVNISIASPSVMREFGLDRVQMGIVFSAFVAGYMLFQIPGGWLGDRFGHKASLTTALLWWSAFTAVTAWVGNRSSIPIPSLLFAFSGARFLIGAGEAV